MEIIKRILVVLFLVTVICAKDVKIKKAKFVFDLEIGANFEDNIFGRTINNVAIDSKNNIYAFDKTEQAIKVFDKNGKFLRKFGNRGNGPSEFKDVSKLLINSKNEIIAYDYLKRKFIVFNERGEYLNSKVITHNGISHLSSIIEYDDDKYVAVFATPDREEKDKSLIFFMSKEFEILEDKINYNLFEKKNLKYPELLAYVTFSASLLKLKDNSLVFVPPYYDGTIFNFAQNNKKWYIKKTHKGFTKNKKAFEKVKETDFYNSQNELKVTSIIQPGNIGVKINNSTRGIYKLKNNFVHFVNSSDKNHNYLFCELFDEKFNLLNVYEIDKLKIVDEKYTPFSYIIRCKDKDDNFYLVSYEKDYPIVKRAKLEFEK